MATIYIDNLVKPKQINYPATVPSKPVNPSSYVYNDLHLDLTLNKNVGNGLNAVNSADITSDFDINAVKNSLYNIFTTRPGQKILNPSFGASLDQFLFESVDNIKAKIIGDTIYNAITKYEPRINVLGVQVMPMPDQNEYYIIIQYKILNIGVNQQLQMQIQNNNNIKIL
jgi:phage baseplate assembly protein W